MYHRGLAMFVILQWHKVTAHHYFVCVYRPQTNILKAANSLKSNSTLFEIHLLHFADLRHFLLKDADFMVM